MGCSEGGGHWGIVRGGGERSEEGMRVRGESVTA